MSASPRSSRSRTRSQSPVYRTHERIRDHRERDRNRDRDRDRDRYRQRSRSNDRNYTHKSSLQSNQHVQPDSSDHNDSSNPRTIDRQKTTPFLLNFCYRSSGFHNLSDFPVPSPSNPNPHLPSHLQIYTWMSCTLRELAHLLTGALPSIVPDPAIGTRLAFRLVYPDTSSSARPGRAGNGTAAVTNSARMEGRLVDDSAFGRGRYISKEMGSVVVSTSASDLGDEGMDVHGNGVSGSDGHRTAIKGSAKFQMTGDDADKTLEDLRFVIGDYIDCAVFPPLSDGSVVPRSAIGVRGSMSGPGGGGGGGGTRENGFGRARSGGGYGYGMRGGAGGASSNSIGGSAAGGPSGPRGSYPSGPSGSSIPTGDWRRGERPPDSGGYRSGGYSGRGGGRSRPY